MIARGTENDYWLSHGQLSRGESMHSICLLFCRSHVLDLLAYPLINICLLFIPLNNWNLSAKCEGCKE